MPHVRSVTIGVWLTRGSRHEVDERSGIAHFVEHMLFKGTDTRTAEDIAQAIDSIGGQLDAFTAKEYAELLHQGARRAPAARRRSAVRHRAASGVRRRRDRAREEGRSSKRSRWSRTRPTTSSTSCSRSTSGKAIRSAGRSSASKETVEAFNARRRCATTSASAYVAPNMIISAAGNLEHAARPRSGRARRSARCRAHGEPRRGGAAAVVPQVDHPHQGARAEPRLPRHDQLSAEPRRSLRQLHPEHGARRLDELAAVPERAREARAGLFRVQRPERVSRRRQPHDLRRLRQRSGRARSSTCASRSCAA